MVHGLRSRQSFLATVACLIVSGVAYAEQPHVHTGGGGDAAALAEKLNNPVAAMISVPLQFNYDSHIGPLDDGSRVQLNIQPVVPFSLDDEWGLISRTILPVIDQDEIFPGAGDQFGLGDITQSLFLSPHAKTAGGLIWGAGPVMLIPTATDNLLGTGKFGLGPTALALKQEHGWTYGILANHIWSVFGEAGRQDVNSTFLQPFLSHTTPEAWTFGINTETTYDWSAETWSVPVNLFVSKLVKFDEQPVSFSLGVRYWADSPESGPEDFGARFVVTFLFPE
jgi:hypothetical protein